MFIYRVTVRRPAAQPRKPRAYRDPERAYFTREVLRMDPTRKRKDLNAMGVLDLCDLFVALRDKP